MGDDSKLRGAYHKTGTFGFGVGNGPKRYSPNGTIPSGLLWNVAHVIIIWHDIQTTGKVVFTERLIGRADCPPWVDVEIYPGVCPEGAVSANASSTAGGILATERAEVLIVCDTGMGRHRLKRFISVDDIL